ncbi:MAG: DUF1501 domain-containing protein [Pirellulaceae bacterium]
MFALTEATSGRGCTRRQWLRLSTLAGLGWTLPPAMGRGDGTRRAQRGFGRAKSVIVVFASGGQSQLDMWDPKPAAPADVRGAFQPIATAVPGVQFTEHMPRVARIADRLTVVRSMSHEDLDHGSAAYLSLTGRYHVRRSANPPPSATDMPTLGAILRRVRSSPRFVYDAIHLNGPALVPREPAPGQDGGILGRASEPLVIGNVLDPDAGVPDLTLPVDLPATRLDGRLRLKESMDGALRNLDGQRTSRDLSRLYRQVHEMMGSASTREAFQLEAEPDHVRSRYGWNRSGQACLLARRLVEAGVPYINVIWSHSNRGQDVAPDDTDAYGWDTHNDIFDALRDRLLPRFDQGFSALIEDLDQRGLLDETLVVCLGEFGRAPRVALEPKFAGASPGRKHWASVYSAVLAGAGVNRGYVLGASDRLGAEPKTERYGPWDLAATIFHALGIDPEAHYRDAVDRPFPIATGRPIEGLYG